jgi:GxxExxY protein
MKSMKGMKDIKEKPEDWHFSDLSHLVIGCAIEVHRRLGPGLLENTYRRCLAHELVLAGARVEVEVPITLEYKCLLVECAYRIDVFVNRQIVVEVKAIDALKWVHEAQVLTYMKLSGARHGFLFNFNSRRLREGMHSYVR